MGKPVEGDIATPDEPRLREKAREAVRAGKLPVRPADRTFGAAGSGQPCAVCGEVIRRDQAEIEIEFERPGGEFGIDRFRLHPRCFAAWEFERTKVGSPERGPSI
jgi:hypothetical protein